MSRTIGPYTLEHLLGEGGMGQVWAAVDGRSGQAVALKLLTAKRLIDGRVVGALRNELRAASRLDHPNLVRILDRGTVHPEDEQAIEGLRSGTPWLSMEMLTGHTLAPIMGRAKWRDIDRVVRSLLAGLAHAHARGVVHRDIKPSNVLLQRSADGQTEVKLTDFGLAYALSDEGRPSDAGTASYMAPEQFHRRWRDFGPWTDLYALGCTLFALLEGHPPFMGAYEQKRHGHLYEAPPELTSPTVGGFETWLGRLMAKDPRMRFRSAAEALMEFELCGTEELDLSLYLSTGGENDLELRPLSTESRRRAALRDGWVLTSPYAAAPPVPSDYRAVEQRRDRPEAAYGSGLIGLHQPEMVGREVERQRLWSDVLRAFRHRLPMWMGVEGPRGVGRTRLLDWLAESLLCSGVANVWRVHHVPQGAPHHGLVQLVRTLLRCRGLTGAELRERLRQLFADVETRQAVQALLDPTGAADPARVCEELVACWLEERPLVILIDDAHWGPQTLQWALQCLRTVGPAALVLVGAAERARLDQRLEARAHWEALANLPRSQTVVLAELALPHLQQIALQLAPIPQPLLNETCNRADGSPQALVHLVADLADRDALRSGPVSRSLAEVWARRIEQVLTRAPLEAVRSIELAAVLGHAVVPSEWAEACQVAQLHPAEDLLEQLLDRQLVIGAGDDLSQGWLFSDGAVRDALLERAKDGERLKGLHYACARALKGVEPARVGEHWMAAGRPDLACRPLLLGVQAALEAGRADVAEERLTQREHALLAIGVPRRDRRWGEGELLRLTLAYRRGDRDHLLFTLLRLERSASRNGWKGIRARCLLWRARLARLRGDLASAEASLLGAQSRWPEGVPKGVLLVDILTWYIAKGRLDAAAQRIQKELVRKSTHRGVIGRYWWLLGEIERRRGHLQLSLEHFREAEGHFERLGDRWALGKTWISRANVARQWGLVTDGLRDYERAEALYRALDSIHAVQPRLQRCLLLMTVGRASEAVVMLEDALVLFLQVGNGLGIAQALSGLAGCAAHLEQWILFDSHVNELVSSMATLGPDVDLAWVLHQVSRIAWRRDQATRAELVESLSKDILLRLEVAQPPSFD